MYVCNLSIYLSIYPSIHLSIYPSIHLSIYPSIHLSIYPSTYLPIYLSTYLSTCLSVSLKTKLFCETSSGFELDNIKNAAILRDFLNVWTWQRQKRRNPARLLHFSKLTTSKTKQFCETSSICTFRSQNVKSTACSDHFFDVQMSFRVAGTRDCAPCQKWAKREGFVPFPKSMAGVGHLKRIWKDAFSVARAVQETCSSELLGGPGVDFLRWVAFWSIRSSGLLRWFCVTGAALRMTWHHIFVAGAVV